MIFARKVNKISEFHMIFVRKMPTFYVLIARKILFANFFSFLWGGVAAPLLPLPVSYTYASD